MGSRKCTEWDIRRLNENILMRKYELVTSSTKCKIELPQDCVGQTPSSNFIDVLMSESNRHDQQLVEEWMLLWRTHSFKIKCIHILYRCEIQVFINIWPNSLTSKLINPTVIHLLRSSKRVSASRSTCA